MRSPRRTASSPGDRRAVERRRTPAATRSVASRRSPNASGPSPRRRPSSPRATRQLELDPANAETDGRASRRPRSTPPAEPDAERLAQIEARLAELRDAEKLFLRTRDELAARSEAVAARERLVAQKERELDDREDGVGQWASPGLTEMEARLRRLEQQQDPSEQTMGFSGGLRKLQQGTTRPQRDD